MMAEDLKFSKVWWFNGEDWTGSLKNNWHPARTAAGPPPIKTKDGWLLIHHGVSGEGYKLGAMLLDYKNPFKILYRSSQPILEPEERYETQGMVSNIVYSCGAVKIEDSLLIYYGGADKVIGVAKINFNELLKNLIHAANKIQI